MAHTGLILASKDFNCPVYEEIYISIATLWNIEYWSYLARFLKTDKECLSCFSYQWIVRVLHFGLKFFFNACNTPCKFKIKNYLTVPLLLEFHQEHLLHTRRKHQNNNNHNNHKDKINVKRIPRLKQRHIGLFKSLKKFQRCKWNID